LLVVVGYALVTRVKYSKVLIVFLSLLIIYMGFRYRLIFLLLPIIFFYFIYNRMNMSSIIKYSITVFGGVFIIATVGVARKYSSGLQVEKLEGLSFYDVLIKGIFNDTSTVIVSGAFIDWLDETSNFAYFSQISYIFNYFIPNAIYPDKQYSPIFSHLSYVTNQLYNESGSAVLGFAEYYHTAGYIGVFIFSILFSIVYVRLFKRAVISGGVYNNYVYFVLVTWLINSFTRGYLPQNIQDLVSVIIGLSMIKILSKKFKFS
ncbi:O-antigen polymerase, partial [Vibrio navarrensis]|uniref:O-antigen polymerase n=1 Tax=Vibrio navarrensis TaxID=29495 RepID=UPI001866FC3F